MINTNSNLVKFQFFAPNLEQEQKELYIGEIKIDFKSQSLSVLKKNTFKYTNNFKNKVKELWQ